MVAFNLENLKFKCNKMRAFSPITSFLFSIHELVVRQNFQGKCLKG